MGINKGIVEKKFKYLIFILGSFAPAGPNTIWKRRITKDNTETKAYEILMDNERCDIVPKFYREVEYNSECILFVF